MKISWITMNVRDIEVSKKFYQSLGLNIAREFEIPEVGKFAFLQTNGDTEIELIEFLAKKDAAPIRDGISFCLALENYEDVLAASREKEILVRGPEKLGGKLDCFFIEDPDGMSIQIVKA